MTNKKSRYLNQDGTYTCECGRSFTNSQSLLAHFGWCISHRSKIGKDCSPEFFNSRNGVGNPGNFKNISKEQRIEYIRRSNESRVRNIKSGKTKPTFLGKHHTEESKEKIRKSRVDILSDGLVHPGFNREDRLTYIERWFVNELILPYNLHCKHDIVNEKSVYPYFLDFAFSDIMLDVEMDGTYHQNDDRIERDKKRAGILGNKGWITYRIDVRRISKESEIVKKEFLEFISKFESNKKYGCVIYRRDFEHILDKKMFK